MLRIGSVVIPSGVVQSPLASCTDLAFRLVAREHGLEFAFLEMVSAHSLALEGIEPEALHIYNVGSGAGYSVRQVIETARRITGHPLPAEEAPRRPGDPPRLVANSDKIRRELGWTPQHPSLEDVIASAWEWHRTHPNGYGV